MCCASASAAGRGARGRTDYGPPDGPASAPPAQNSSSYRSRRGDVTLPPPPLCSSNAAPCAKAGATRDCRFSCAPDSVDDSTCSTTSGLSPPPTASELTLPASSTGDSWDDGLLSGPRRAACLPPAGAGAAADDSCCGDGCSLHPSVALSEATDRSLYDCDTALTAYSEPQRSSFLSQHTGWATGDVPAAAAAAAAAVDHCTAVPLTAAVTAAAAVPAAAAPLAAAAAAAAAAATGRRATARGLATGDVNGNGVDVEDDDNDDGGEGDAEIRALLRPGGSPCLPLEDDWTPTKTARRAGVGAAATSPSDEVLSGSNMRWRGPLSSSSTSSSGGCGGSSTDDLCSREVSEARCGHNACNDGTAAAAAAAPTPPPTAARHRACQLGYTDSAPAHATAAAAAAARVTGDIALAFLRAPEGAVAAWRQVLGGTLSAPPTAVPQPRAFGPLAESASPASALGLASVRPLASAAAAASTLFDLELSGEFEFEFEEQLLDSFDGRACGMPASAAAVAASAAPPPRPGAAKPRPASAGPASRWALTGAAATPSVAPPSDDTDGLSIRPRSAATDVSPSSYESIEAAAPLSNYFGSSLADGLPSLLRQLAADRADGSGGGGAADACSGALRQRNMLACRSFGRFGRGLLGCFVSGR